MPSSLCSVDAAADRQRALVHPVLQARCVLQRDGDDGIEFLPDARHGEEDGRLHLAQIVGHRLRAFGEVHHRSKRHRGVVAGDAFGDVAQRQEHQPFLVVTCDDQVVGMAHLTHHAAVGMHGALGRTCRAGGVDQDREIIAAAACQHLVPEVFAALHVIAAERGELGERHHHRIGEAREALHVEYDDALQGRAARAAAQNLVELLFVLDEDHLGAEIVDEIFDLRRRVGRIDARRHAAGAEDAHVGMDPFGHRIRHDGGDVAGLKADRMQRVGDVPGDRQPLAPGRRLPDAELLFADRRPVAARLHREQKALRNRVGDCQHCRCGHADFPPSRVLPASLCRSCVRSSGGI